MTGRYLPVGLFGVNPEKAVCVLFVSFVKWFDVRTERLLNGLSQPNMPAGYHFVF